MRDLFTALSAALEKLEKQAVKQRAKWREKASPYGFAETAEDEVAGGGQRNSGTGHGEARREQRVFRVNRSRASASP